MNLLPLNSANGTIKRIMFVDNVPIEANGNFGSVIVRPSFDSQVPTHGQIYARHQKIIDTMRIECPGIEFWYIQPCKFDVAFSKDKRRFLQTLDTALFNVPSSFLNFASSTGDVASPIGNFVSSVGDLTSSVGDFALPIVQWEAPSILEDNDIKRILVDLDLEFLTRQLAQRGLFGRLSSPSPEIPDPTLPLDWIQDAFFVQTDELGEDIVLLDSYYFWVNFPLLEEGVDDSRALAEVVSSYLPRVISGCPFTSTVVKSTKYIFQGGNVVSGDDFVFVGLDIIRRNFIAYFPESSSELDWRSTFDLFFRDFARTFSANYVVCPGFNLLMERFDPGNQASDLKHLDQFLTFGGAVKGEQNLYRVLVGKLFDWNDSAGDWAPVDSRSSEVQLELDAIEEWFKSPEKFGFSFPFSFDVKRIPIMKNGEEIWYSPNCHLQTKGEALEAFVPEFAVGENSESCIHKKADELIEKMFKAADIDRTIRIPQKYLVNASADRAGLHCLTVVLSRTFS